MTGMAIASYLFTVCQDAPLMRPSIIARSADGPGSIVGSWAYAGQVAGETTPLAVNYSGNDAPNYPPFRCVYN